MRLLWITATAGNYQSPHSCDSRKGFSSFGVDSMHEFIVFLSLLYAIVQKSQAFTSR